LCWQAEALEDALRQLLILDAIDREGHITALGKRMAALPLEPSLARSLLAAADHDCLPEALTTAAMLSAETIFSGNRLRLMKVHIFWGAIAEIWLAVSDVAI